MTTALGHAFDDIDICARCKTPYEVALVERIKCRPRGTETTGVIESLYPPDRDSGDER